jgi:ubiquinol-cytochrome c reductase cytochrome b subunit
VTRWNFNSWLASVDSHIVDYPTPITLNYNWSYGSAAGICLAIQILSGVFLAMHYTPHIDYAFASLEHIIRDVEYGWFLRYLHANGASFFFIVVYLHIFRGLYHGSYERPRQILWCSGVVIFILIIATAFLGYVLPWGQISFWGATVITNLFSAIPGVGKEIVKWLWGGFSVDNATLNRFFSFHYILPFVITAIVFIHLGLLHKDGSNNPLGTKSTNTSFYPYFYVKDLLVFFILITILTIFVFFWSNTIGHPDNYIPADPLKTPAHIVPEWYFLPFYAILRSIPDKLGGVVAIGGALVALLIIPFIQTSSTRSATFRPIYKVGFWLWLGTFLLLGWVGQIPVSGPYVFIGQVVTGLYFFLLLFGVRLIGILENYLAQRPVSLKD